MRILNLQPGIPESDRQQIPPLRNQFEAMVAGRHAGLLVEPMVRRFPFQTPFAPYHPALDADYLILRSLKGSLFFRAHSFRDEAAFIKLIRRKNYQRDVEEKYRQFRDFHLLLTKKDQNRKLEAELQKSRELFTLRAENSWKYTRLLSRLQEERSQKTSDFGELRVEAYDRKLELYHRLFWEAVYRNLQKEPREINISSLNLQDAFRAMAFADSQSQILRIMNLIKINRIKSQAEQLLEHSSGLSLPSELISAFHMRFHRSTFEREIRNELSEEAYRDFLSRARKYRLDQAENFVALKMERQIQTDERYRVYWDIFDHLHEMIPLNLSMSQTNLQEVYKLFRYRQDAQVHHAFRAIQANRNKMMASQLNERVETLIPEIASQLKIFFQRFRYEDLKSMEKKIADSQMAFTLHQEANLERFFRYLEKRSYRINQAESAIKSYLKAWDHENQELFLSISQSASNLTEAMRRAFVGKSGRMLTVKGQIALLKGYEPVDPVTAKTRKTNMSFQTGWKEFMEQPPPYVPKASLPVRKEFDAKENPSEYYRVMNQIQVDFHFHNIWYLRQEIRDFSNYSERFRSETDPKASKDRYKSEFRYSLREANKKARTASFPINFPSRDEGFHFERTGFMTPGVKNLPKAPERVSRNRSDARDLELKEAERETPVPDTGRYQEVTAERKADLKKTDLTNAVIRHQESFPLEYQSSYEHQLAFQDDPVKVENQPTRRILENVYQARPGITQSREIVLTPAIAKEAMGTRWQLTVPRDVAKKRKFPRS